LSTTLGDAASRRNAVPVGLPPGRAAEHHGEGDRQRERLPSVIGWIARWWALAGGAEEPHKVRVLDEEPALDLVQRRAFAVTEHDPPPGAAGL